MAHITMISAIHHAVYSRYVISKSVFVLYMIILLKTSVNMDIAAKISVRRKVTESPRPNHAVSENGMYMLRKTNAKRTEKVTVPISWYFPSRYAGILSLIVILCRF